MKRNALSVANEFIDLSAADEVDVTPLKLMKLVYLAHGFALALLDRPMLDIRFDWVEAWAFGPVIPSVYHTFKYNGRNPVRQYGIVFRGAYDDDIETPHLTEEDDKKIVKLVWDLYKDKSAKQLVEELHKKGSPWAEVYEEGLNKIIPDDITRSYYKKMITIWTDGKY